MNASTSISLSIGQNTIDILPPDFDIKTNLATYRCHSHRIILFSPMVRKMFLSDPCLRSIQYPYRDDDGTFTQIHNLIYGREIAITVDNSLNLLIAAMFFENSELSRGVTKFILKNYQKELLTSTDYFPLNNSILYLRPSLSYITSNIQSFISRGELKDYSLLLLDVILGNPEQEIQIDNESVLFDWICQIVLAHKDTNPEYLSLFAHVCFDDLDTERIDRFLRICPVSAITGALWKAICCRLKIPVIDAPAPIATGPVNFPFNGNMFDGVFHYLCKDMEPLDHEIVMDCGGNKRWALVNLLDPTDNSKFWENASNETTGAQVYREEDQWIEVIFLNAKLRLTHYTIAHAVKAPNSTQPRDWRLLASVDGNYWDVIHEVKNAVELNCAAGRHTYEVPPCSKSYQHFKLQQTANFYKKVQTKYRFVLCAIEFFGNLEELTKP